MASKKAKDKKNKNKKMSKTVQQTIPYIGAYKNGIIETAEGYFTKSYRLEDVDFKIAAEDIAEQIYTTFGKLINTFDSSMLIQFTIDNQHINKKEFEKSILTKMQGNDLDGLRQEYNQVLKDKLKVIVMFLTF